MLSWNTCSRCSITLGVGVVGPTVVGAPGEAGAGDVVVEREVHRGLGVDTERMRELVGALGLDAGPREAVEDVAARQARTQYRVGDDLDDRVVGDEITTRDAFGDLDPERRPRFDMRTQQLAARDVRNARAGRPAAHPGFPCRNPARRAGRFARSMIARRLPRPPTATQTSIFTGGGD